MDEKTLNAVSPIDGRYQNKCKNLSHYFSEAALIYYRTLVEIKWFEHLASLNEIKELPELSKDAKLFLTEVLKQPKTKIASSIKDIEQTTKHDVKAVEYYLASEFSKNNELKQHIPFLHFACTSEDINNISYNLMIKEYGSKEFVPLLDELIYALDKLINETANSAMISRTHGQPATPTTMGKELSVFKHRISNYIRQIKQLNLTGKFNGAVGNYNAHVVAYPNVNWERTTKDFLANLGLEQNTHTTQIEPHDTICNLLNLSSSLNCVAMDLAKDMWSYISIGYFVQNTNAEEVGSSTMPHKVNPIDFENAEGNFGIANALSNYFTQKLPISRMQRDLSDSTTFRNVGVCFAHTYIAVKNLIQGLNKIAINSEALAQDLENEWSLLAEPIQTIMRKHKIADAYEQLKEITRGKKITKESIQNFISSCDLPQSEKEKLLQLTPSSYLGIAKTLARS